MSFFRYLFFVIVLSACTPYTDFEEVKQELIGKEIKIENIQFNADTALYFLKTLQPELTSDDHQTRRKIIVNQLKNSGAQIEFQYFDAINTENNSIKLANIIGKFQPNIKPRILLMARYDSQNIISENKIKQTLIGGLNGVATLLEITRNIGNQNTQLAYGVDIVFLDGTSRKMNSENNVCLGSKHWAKEFHGKSSDYLAGILLNFEGTNNGVFPREHTSTFYARNVINDIWAHAHILGFENLFTPEVIYFISTDDHTFVNEMAGIPSIDIIQYDKDSKTYANHSSDTSNSKISTDKTIIEAVGKTLSSYLSVR